MDFHLNEELSTIQQNARLFDEKEMLHHAAEWDKKKICPV